MYNPEQKQIILKNSFGVSYHVFHESGRGLCIRMLGDSGIWSRGYVLSEIAVNDFSVILDKDDIFHFVFQSQDGRILYGHGRHGQIEVQPVLSSRDTTPWMKHVSLIMDGNIVLFFYMVRYQKRYLLSMQTLKDNMLSKPAAIDYVDGPGRNYLAFIDDQGKCRLIYTNNNGSVKRLNLRSLNKDTGVFSAPEKIYGSEHEVSFTGAVSIHKRVHLLYQVSSENSYEVFYRELESEKPAQCMYKGNSPPGYTGLVFCGGTLRFFRISSDNIHVRSSEDNGANWTDEALYPFSSRGSLTCFTYFTNYTKEKQELSCHELPGSFSRGYQLAFLSKEASAGFLKDLYPEIPGTRPPVISEEEDKPNPEGKGNDSGKDRQNNDQQKSALKEIQKKVLQLQNLTENMQRELTKLWLAQKDYEKKVILLGHSLEHLKNARPIPRTEDIEAIENMSCETAEEHWLKESRSPQRSSPEEVFLKTEQVSLKPEEDDAFDADFYTESNEPGSVLNSNRPQDTEIENTGMAAVNRDNDAESFPEEDYFDDERLPPPL